MLSLDKKMKLYAFVLIIFTFATLSYATSFCNPYGFNNDSTEPEILENKGILWEIGIIECDCGKGNIVKLEHYIDIDTSRTFTPGDMIASRMIIIDGDTIPTIGTKQRDANLGPDGLIRLENYIPFNPGPHVVIIIDEDGSTIENWFDILPNPNLPIVIEGSVKIEGITPPNDIFSKIRVGKGSFWAFVDNYGNFTFELLKFPGNDTSLTIMDYGSGFVFPEPLKIEIPRDGKISGIEINMQSPTAWIMGNIIDQNGEPVNEWLRMHLYFDDKQASEKKAVAIGSDYSELAGHIVAKGSYCFGVFENIYRLALRGISTNNSYMLPSPQCNSSFQLAEGDTLQKDIMCYKTDNFVYVKIERPEVFKNRSFLIRASSEGYYNESNSHNLTGIAKIPICTEVSNVFYISLPLSDFRDYNFYIEEQTVSVGDTITVEIITIEEAKERKAKKQSH